ncbi:MAG: manganese ABC transporter ATP-binding protein [Deltaproteobacteria bacterium]|nr:MAG: manganese ABC transporter ATP-binding protein [Deltaproteobacteria bacterium]
MTDLLTSQPLPDSHKSFSGPCISFERVGLRFGNTTILEDINFNVENGTIHCLIGPNGGGKTCLARSLLGQMPHTGRITINWPAGKVIGYVPQLLDFDHTLPITVDDFMAMICQDHPAFFGLKKKHHDAVTRSLAAVGMESLRKRQMGQLSGGERQRVLFAQALLPSPDLLILDEPMTGLDEVGSSLFEDMLIKLKNNGVTIFWIHHDLKQVKKMADFVTCVNRKILFSGSPADVLTADRILNVLSREQAFPVNL